MSQITTRHIRHDWQAWIDAQSQRSVMALCGSKTRPGLAGIPGITYQEPVVFANDSPIWGWCSRCVERLYKGWPNRFDPIVKPEEISRLETTPEIKALYFGVHAGLLSQTVWLKQHHRI